MCRLSLALGTVIVIALYILANFAYTVVLPFAQIQNAPSDRVAAAVFEVIFPGIGATIIAVAIMISAFGCMNGMILAGARAYFAMALDGVFFKRAGDLNDARVPSSALEDAGPVGGGAGADPHLQSRHRQPTAISTATCWTMSSRRR